MLLGHVLETDGDTAAQHVLGDDEDAEDALGRNAVDSIWKIKQKISGGTADKNRNLAVKRQTQDRFILSLACRQQTRRHGDL